MALVAGSVSICRYQRRLAWATDFLRRQGQDESTARSILEEYTKPVQCPSEGSSTEGQLQAGLLAGTAGLPGMDGASGTAQETGEADMGSGPDPVAAAVFRDHVGEDLTPTPWVPSCAQDALSPQCGLQPAASSLLPSVLHAGERESGPEFVLVEEEATRSEREDTLEEEVKRKGLAPSLLCFRGFSAHGPEVSSALTASKITLFFKSVTFITMYC